MFFKTIAVDFDGTLCESKWPDIGEPNHEVINYVLDQQKQGVKIILWTCRTNQQLAEAVAWCKEHSLIFDAVNENIPEAIELFGEDTRKVHAEEYIDDKASTRFRLPFKKDGGLGVVDELNTIENFLSKTDQIIEFAEMQAIVKMQYDLYRRLVTPTYIIGGVDLGKGEV